MHLRQLSSGSLRRVGERQGPRTALPPTLAGAQVGLWAVVMMCYAHLAPSNVCCCAGDGGREAWPGEILQGRACCASVTGCPPGLAARLPAGTPPPALLAPPPPHSAITAVRPSAPAVPADCAALRNKAIAPAGLFQKLHATGGGYSVQ